MKFKIGQKVRIKRDSSLYDNGHSKDINGIIIKIDTHERNFDIYVDWDYSYSDWFYKEDLEYWYKQPVRDLLDDMEQNHTTGLKHGSDTSTIREWIDDESSTYVSKEELIPLKNLWEKWNKSKFNKKNR